MNIYDYVAKETGRELNDILLTSDGCRIERIVSAGETSDWYDQAEDEWIVLISGEAALDIAEDGAPRTIALKAGDTRFIPAHQRHRVARTSIDPPCLWLCIFIQPDKDART